jgi:O-antigen/teichoic acid export membrane protein
VFVMAPINASFTPHMAHLLHTGQLAEAAKAYGSASRWILMLSMPSFIVLIAFSEQLLGYFGKGFQTAAAVTVVLSFGQLVSAAAGPCGTVLNMSGRVGLNMIDNVAVLVLNVILNVILIPRHGVLGAAVAWSISLVLVNLVKVVQVYVVVGIRAVGSEFRKIALASLPAAGTAWILTNWVRDWVGTVFWAAPVVAVVFLGTLLSLGVQPDDRALAASLVRRLRDRPAAGAATR